MGLRQVSIKKSLFSGGKEYIFDGEDKFIAGKTIIKLSPVAINLYSYMDGKTSDEELKKKAENKFQIRLAKKDFNQFVRTLKKKGLLEGRLNGCLVGKLSPWYLKQQQIRFNKKRVRQAVYAGICYKKDPKELIAELKGSFAAVTINRKCVNLLKNKRIKGIVAPHSNMELSATCAAWSYKALAQIPKPDLLIILGPAHYCLTTNPYSLLLKDFRTPLGTVKVDRDFGKMIGRCSSFDVFDHNLLHLSEHSIEVQLPYLQYIYRHSQNHTRRRKNEMKILPLLCSPVLSKTAEFSTQRERFIALLKDAIIKSDKRILVMAAGDLDHTCQGLKPIARFHRNNKNIIRLLREGNAEHFKRQFMKNNNYNCCSTTVFYTFLKLLEPCKGEKLNYSWTSKSKFASKDTIDEKYERLTSKGHLDIGYVSIIFY